MHRRFIVSIAALAVSRRGPCARIRFADDRAQRDPRPPGREQEPDRAGHLPERGTPASHARLGRDQRAHPEARPATGLVQARLLGRLGIAPQGSLARLQERLRPVPGARAELRRRRLHGAGRLALGRPEVAPAAAPVRDAPHVRAAGGRAAALALPATSPSSWSRSTGSTASTTISTAGSSTRARASTGSRVDDVRLSARQVGPERLRRHVRLTLRPRLEARERISDASLERRLLLRVLPHGNRPVGKGRSTARP